MSTHKSPKKITNNFADRLKLMLPVKNKEIKTTRSIEFIFEKNDMELGCIFCSKYFGSHLRTEINQIVIFGLKSTEIFEKNVFDF